MKTVDTNLVTLDGLRLRVRAIEPPDTPRGVLLITHGHGEHSGRYLHVLHAAQQAGFAAAAYDLRGHGLSEGPRGHLPHYGRLLDDLQLVREDSLRRWGKQPLFLFGHSLGGQITLQYSLSRGHGVCGVLVNAPLLRMAYLPPAWKIILAKLLYRAWPQFTQKSGLRDEDLSSDRAFLSSLENAHLRHTYLSARLGLDLLEKGAELLVRAPSFSLPLLVTHGANDPIVSPAGSQAFLSACGSPDKTLHLFPGLLHETHNEPARAEVLETWFSWLGARAGAEGSSPSGRG